MSDVVHHDARRSGAAQTSRHGWPRLHDPVGPELVHRAGHQGLYRTEMLRTVGGWYAGQRIGFDTSMLNFVLMAGGRVVDGPEPLYHRNIRTGSLSTSPRHGLEHAGATAGRARAGRPPPTRVRRDPRHSTGRAPRRRCGDS